MISSTTRTPLLSDLTNSPSRRAVDGGYARSQGGNTAGDGSATGGDTMQLSSHSGQSGTGDNSEVTEFQARTDRKF